jgi:Nucleotidyl transferase of unknown function (DUF2204)
LIAAAVRLQADWESRGIEFCFIGGLAVQHWGEPRLTNDVDATVWTDFGNERPVIKQLLENLSPRIEDAAGFAVVNRVLLAQEKDGVDVDISLGAFPFERDIIARSKKQAVAGNSLIRICSPSDLVILKAFANRPRDWQDIRGVLIRSNSELDWELIFAELTQLAALKEEPEIVDQLNNLRTQLRL